MAGFRYGAQGRHWRTEQLALATGRITQGAHAHRHTTGACTQNITVPFFTTTKNAGVQLLSGSKRHAQQSQTSRNPTFSSVSGTVSGARAAGRGADEVK